RWYPEISGHGRAARTRSARPISLLQLSNPLWKKLRATNHIERVFVELRRRTRPMVSFVNVASVDRIIYSIYQRFNLDWRNRTLRVLHKPLDITILLSC